VESFNSHEHTVEHEGARSDRLYEHWFHVERADGGSRFRVVVNVSTIAAHLAKTAGETLAAELGTAHVKGLIDLGYESGRQYEVSREVHRPTRATNTSPMMTSI
jgi:hypothetical protein